MFFSGIPNYLADGLGGKADENGNNKTTAYELYKYIENQLQYDTVDSGGAIGRQVPLLAAAGGFDPQISPPYNKKTKLYGVIIGISKYRNQNNLQNADKDAERIHRALSRVYSSDQRKLILLTNSSATKSNIIKNLESLRSEVTPNDIFIVYFSGHGTSDARGFLEWVAFDGDLGSSDGSLNINIVKSFFRTFNARAKLVFMDTAYPG